MSYSVPINTWRAHGGFCVSIVQYMQHSKIVGALDIKVDHDGYFHLLPSASPNSPGSILLLSGASSPDAVREICATFNIDRTVLETHLDFRSSRLPCIGHLPSRPNRALAVRFITIGSLGSGYSLPPDGSDAAILADFATQLAVHHKECAAGLRLGRDCFRRLNLHSRHFFSVEQETTFSVQVTADKTWSAALLSDNGLTGYPPPWTVKRKDFLTAQFYSLGRSRPAATQYLSEANEVRQRFDQGAPIRPNPFQARLVDDAAMPPEDYALCAKDPFVLVADLLETSALCWMQLLNFLRDLHQGLPVEANARAAVLSRDRAVIDQCIKYASEMIRFVELRNNLGWPRCIERNERERVNQIAEDVKRDFETIRDDAISLGAMFKDSIDIAMSTTTIRAAEQSLAHGKQLHLLTYLAFVFIPILLVSSIFGMSIRELSPPPSITLFFAVALPLALLCLLIPSLSISRSLHSTVARFVSHL